MPFSIEPKRLTSSPTRNPAMTPLVPPTSPRFRHMALHVAFPGPWLLSVCLIGAVCLCGCEPPPRPPLTSTDRRQEDRELSRPRDEAADQSPTLADGQTLKWTQEVPREIWDAYFQGIPGDLRQVGYSHIEVGDTGQIDSLAIQDRIDYRTTERVLVPINGDVQEQFLIHEFVESTSGQLQSFSAQFQLGGTAASATGKVDGVELQIEVQQADETKTRTLAWQPSYHGFLALQQQLFEQPLTQGETQSLTLLAPMLFEIGRLELEAVGLSTVQMLDGTSVDGLEVDVRSSRGNQQTSVQNIWINEDGEILKQFLPNQQLYIFRTDRPTATLVESPVAGLVDAIEIPLKKRIDSTRDLAGLGFFVSSRVDGQDAGELLRSAPGQIVTLDEETGKLAVASVRWDNDKIRQRIEADYPAPSKDDRQPSTLIDSKNADIQAMAFLAGSGDKVEQIIMLAQRVRTALAAPLNRDVFASATCAVALGQGDRTEHALVLAAVCRAAKFPARVAAGWVHDANTQSLKFGMWTVVHTGQQWIPVDATQENPLQTNDRITLVTDPLSTLTTDFGLFKSVQQATNALDFELVRIQYADPVEPPADDNP